MTPLIEQARQAAARALAEKLQYFGTNAEQVAAEMSEIALTAAAPHLASVRVKKLEWTNSDEKRNDEWLCATDASPSYSIMRWWLDDARDEVGHFEVEGLGEDQFGTMDGAKAAAQADYEARILSALEPSAGDCECTKVQQDETCPVGYPSLLCEICDGKGVVQPSAGRAAGLEEADDIRGLIADALRPFAEQADEYSKDEEDWKTEWPSFEIGDFRRAAKAFAALHPVADKPDEAGAQGEGSFQDRVKPWMLACFGEEISNDKLERCDRFIEEALELVQAIGYSPDRAHALVDYVFNREIGEPHQEVGGVMVTLAALCLASGLDMDKSGEDELARIWTKIEKIRAKRATKPTGSALPVPTSGGRGMSKHEYITIDGHRYQKFIQFPEEVTDGTMRCIACGQIDDEPWHDHDICEAERKKHWDAVFATHPSGGDRHGE